jgi:2-methylcitrate dehydratase
MDMDGPTRAIVEFVAAADYDELSASCVHSVVRNYLDSVGCAAAGMDGEPTIILRQIAAATSGTPAASAFGLAQRPLVEFAVLANATATRYRDWNDGGLGAGHASDMGPALFALAEANGASGAKLVESLYIAYQVLGVMAPYLLLRDRGWDQGLGMSIAVVAGLAKLTKMSPDELANAIAIAVTPSVPLRVSRIGELSHFKATATAHAVMTATLAARLAKAGLTGPRLIFEAAEGVFEKISEAPFEMSNLIPEPGGETIPERVQHKYFPAIMESQGPVASMLKLRGQSRSVDDIESITLTTFHLAWHEGGGGQGDHDQKWNPQTRETADHSIPYVMARALVDGPIDLDSFTPEKVRDASLRPLLDKISVVENKEYTARRRSHNEENCLVEVTFANGTSWSDSSTFALGHPRNPMSDEQLSGKFDSAVGKVLDRARHDELRERLWNIPDEKTLEPVAALYREFSC